MPNKINMSVPQKLKAVPKANNVRRVSRPLILMMLILSMCGYFLGACFSGQDPLSETIKQSYIAVLPFENKTGQEEYAVIGEMAADWLTSGLQETGEGKILSVNEVNRTLESSEGSISSLLGALNYDPDVRYLIEGNYYAVGDSLIFSSNISDLRSGEIVFSFPLIGGKAAEVTTAIEELKQRILGFWVTKDRAGYEKRPPVYEAYKAYLEGGKVWYTYKTRSKQLMQKAVELDSNFHYAAFGYAHQLISHGQNEKADSLVKAYQQKTERLNEMEQEFLNGLQARLYRNPEQSWRHWHSPYILAYWGRNHVLKQRSDALIWKYNQPQMVLDLLADVNFEELDYVGEPTTRNLYFNKVDAYLLLGENEQALKMLMNIPFELQRTKLILGKLQRLARLKAYDELEQEMEYFKHSLSSQGIPNHYIRWFTVWGLLVTDDEEKAIEETRVYLRFLEEKNQDLRPGPNGFSMQSIQAGFYLAVGDTDKAGEMIERGIGIDEDNPFTLALLGMYYAKVGNELQAQDILNQLEALDSEYDFGISMMNMAIIECWLGNEDRAVELLREARYSGARRWTHFFDGDWRLKPLFDHPGFVEMLQPEPVPQIAPSTKTLVATQTNYWPYLTMLALGLSGFVGWFVLQKRPWQEVKIEDNKLAAEEEVSQPKEAEDELLTQLNQVLESSLDDPELSLSQICERVGMSRAQFYRRIKALTNQSPSVYIRSFRLQKAKELLQSTDLNISEVAYQVGFKDLSYFSRSFSDEFGVSPTETRK